MVLFLLDIKGQGYWTMEPLEIDGVLYMPDSGFNLVSVDFITKGAHYKILFGKKECLLTKPFTPEFT